MTKKFNRSKNKIFDKDPPGALNAWMITEKLKLLLTERGKPFTKPTTFSYIRESSKTTEIISIAKRFKNRLKNSRKILSVRGTIISMSQTYKSKRVRQS